MDWHNVSDLALKGLEHLAAAAAILVCGLLVAVIVRALVRRWLRRHEEALGPTFVRMAYISIYYEILALTVGLCLIALGVPTTFVVAIGVVVLVIVVIALRESVADLAATVIFLVFRPFKRGELVETLGHVGDVQEILMFNTVLLLRDQRLVTLPNSKIQEDGVVNYTRRGGVQVEVSFTVGYEEDLNRVRTVLGEIASDDARILRSPPVEITIEDLTETGVCMQVAPTVAPSDYWDVSSDLREQIKARFDANGIRFAVPARDVIVRRPRSATEDAA